MYILQQLYLTNSLSTACLGKAIIKIKQIKILLRVQWTRLVVRGLRISGAIPLLNLSVSMAHSGTTLFYLYIFLNRSHPFCSFKGTFLHITYLLHAHCMTHLFHLHLSNYINIINSSNNEHQYIILRVLLLLTPSTGQIFSG